MGESEEGSIKEWPFPREPEEILFRKRIIALPYVINPEVLFFTRDSILALDALCKEPITLYIDCVGGNVDCGLGIYDVMNFVKSPIATVCNGVAGSIAAVILAGGNKEMRYIFPHSRIMIHQPTGQFEGKQDEVEIFQEQMNNIYNILTEILAKHTGQKKKRILGDIKLDKWFNAKESVEYGLVDKVITNYKDLR